MALPQLPPGAGFVAGQPGVKQFHWPFWQSHSSPPGYGQMSAPRHDVLSVGIVAGQALPLPTQRQSSAFARPAAR